MQLTLLYVLFAAISTVANIAAQAGVSYVYRGPYALFGALVVGTGVGLFVKYLLDKRWIFRYQTQGVGHDAKLFVLYTTMGLATTAIFWGTEFAFDRIFGGQIMRYVGALIGLAIGYLVKYRLDKAFVFSKQPTTH